MTPARSIEARLAELDGLRGNAGLTMATTVLRRALAAKAAPVTARAAALAGAESVTDLVPDLVRAFGRLIREPAKADPGCRAKTAIADALQKMAPEIPAPEACAVVFLPGVRHVQMEPVWGGRTDTAGDLRAVSAFALVRLDHPGVLTVLADLLADPLHTVRLEAARALAWRGRADAVPLLRLRLHLPEEEPAALGAYVAALLELDPEGALPLAAEALETASDDDRFHAVSLALGESRTVGALSILRDLWDHEVGGLRRNILVTALILLRRDEAFAFLVERLADASAETAAAILEALAPCGPDAGFCESVAQAVTTRGDPALSCLFDELFAQS